MSGLNPFRPKKPEATPATVTAPAISTATAPTSTPATPPATATTTPTATATAAATHPASSSIHSRDNDTSDDTDPESTDPFGQASYLSDDGYNGENDKVHSSSNSAPRLSTDGSGTKTQTGRRPLPTPPARPASISSGSSNLARQPSNASIVSSLSSRPSTRDRKPPPPPKNHHGKLINPSSVSPETPARTGTTPGTGTPYSTKHLGPDYFTPGPSQDESQPGSGSGSGSGPGPGPDTLRRSHSQYKRPPTPPLSRRHSQMTRSKSTLSKPTRLSMPAGVGMGMPVGTTDESESAPSSPDTDDPVSKYPREDRSVVPASPIETPSPGKIPARRGSAQAQGPATLTPPPPPPRRAARPGSIISDRPSQEQQEQQEQQQNHQDGFPHPSNANHILEDLSRLQKEVDDLRGRYENRKSVI